MLEKEIYIQENDKLKVQLMQKIEIYTGNKIIN